MLHSYQSLRPRSKWNARTLAELKWCVDHFSSDRDAAARRLTALLQSVTPQDRAEFADTVREMLAEAKSK